MQKPLLQDEIKSIGSQNRIICILRWVCARTHVHKYTNSYKIITNIICGMRGLMNNAQTWYTKMYIRSLFLKVAFPYFQISLVGRHGGQA